MITKMEYKEENLDKELQEEMGMASVVNFIIGKRIQWLRYVMQKIEDNISRAVLN